MAFFTKALSLLSTIMFSPSFECERAEFLPAPATLVNVAVAFTFFMGVRYFTQSDPLILAINAVGSLFSSTESKNIFVQVSPGPTPKFPPTLTQQYQPEYQSKSTSSTLCMIALCVVFILVGGVFTVLRKSSTTNIYGDIPEDYASRPSKLSCYCF